MERWKFFLSAVFLGLGQLGLSQVEAVPMNCSEVASRTTIDTNQRATLVREVRAADTYHCASLDIESGFAAKLDSLMKMTSLQEKLELFNVGSSVFKFYLFRQILLQSDSVGYEVLRGSIKDTSVLTTFCSCMIEESELRFEMINYYCFFIELKYKLGVAGTSGGWIVYFNEHQKKPEKKKWKTKMHDLRLLVRADIDLVKLRRDYPTIPKELFN